MPTNLANLNLASNLGQPLAVDADLAVLLAAPGLVAFYDSSYGITLSSGVVSSWAPRTGTDTLTAAGAARPTYGSVSAGGKSGVVFDGASQYIHLTSSTLAGVMDGAQAYSSLVVARTAGGSTRATWGAGAQANAEYVREGVSSGADWRIRRTTASGSLANTGTGAVGTSRPFLIANVYSGTAYNGYTNGVQTLTASANTRAPVCNIFSIGANFESGIAGYRFDGPIWCVLLSTSQWTTAQREEIQRAANNYWNLGFRL